MRAAPEASGLDQGPISVHDKMQSLGLTQVPSNGVAGTDLREAVPVGSQYYFHCYGSAAIHE